MPEKNTIFINYRRHDSSASAGRLTDRLVDRFGRDQVFFDVDAIPVGVDFVDYLSEQVARTCAMLIIIGQHWLNSADDTGRLRLENPNDFVRVEIEAALARDITIIPVLVDEAKLPRRDLLPKSLQPLVNRQAIAIRHETFNSDIAPLLHMLDGLVGNERREPGSIEQRPDHPQNLLSTFRSARSDGFPLSKLLEMIEEENLRILDERHNMEELKDHIDLFSHGATQPLALARLEYIMWKRILERRTPSSVSEYLARFPSGSYAEDAREIRDQLLTDGGTDRDRFPRVFLNYRRIDSQDSADRIFERLVAWVPKNNVLMDVDKRSIVPGLPVKPQLERLVNSCDIMLVVIHNRWLAEFVERSAKHESGDILDYVRIEIKADRKELMPIVPVLLGDTPAPRSTDLPNEIQALMQRSAHKISRDSNDADLAVLIRQVTKYFEVRES
jgi:TIR domain